MKKSTAAAPKKRTKFAEQKGHVIRISPEAYSTLKLLKGKLTYTEFFFHSMAVMKKLDEAPKVYLSGSKVFTDIKEARGEAIMSAIAKGQIPEAPSIAIVFEKDSLE